jgi:hypothetical protein
VESNTFGKLEEVAQQEGLRRAREQAHEERVAQEAFAASKARLRAQVCDFLVHELRLDRAEVDTALEVNATESDLEWPPDYYPPDVALCIEEHARIGLCLKGERTSEDTFHLVWDGQEPFVVEGTKFAQLGQALLAAKRAHRCRLATEADEAKRAALRQAQEAREEAEEAARIGRVAALLASCPPLGPMLDVLLGWVEEHEQFAAELEAANEWAASIERRMGRKLAAARNETDRLALERDDLERRKWELEDEVAAATRQAKRGW